MTIREEIDELIPFSKNIPDSELIEVLERIIMMSDEEWIEDNQRLLSGLKAEIREKKIDEILKK
jgi:hypothetical protein